MLTKLPIRVCIIFGIAGFITGSCALPFQYLTYGMESPSFAWILKVPVLGIAFGTITICVIHILLVILGSILELFDKDAHWPHQ